MRLWKVPECAHGEDIAEFRRRADARRNRELVLEAADAIFSEFGPTASTEEVAKRAGVSIGTVFRHFATKDELIAAVVLARLAQLTDEAERLSAIDDPEAAFITFAQRWIGLSASKHRFADALIDSGTDVRKIRDAHPEIVGKLHDAVGVLLERAQRAERIREDLDVDDVIALLVSASYAHEHVGPDPQRLAHLVSIIFDGLCSR